MMTDEEADRADCMQASFEKGVDHARRDVLYLIEKGFTVEQVRTFLRNARLSAKWETAQRQARWTTEQALKKAGL